MGVQPIIDAISCGMSPRACPLNRRDCPIIHIADNHSSTVEQRTIYTRPNNSITFYSNMNVLCYATSTSSATSTTPTCPLVSTKLTENMIMHISVDHADDDARLPHDPEEYERIIANLRYCNDALAAHLRELEKVIEEIQN